MWDQFPPPLERENEDMNDLTTQGSLEFEVADFGPIVEAKIDLRPLTVFVGPSNTGKSYLAILIYALHRYFSNLPHQLFFEVEEKDLPRNGLDTLLTWAEQEFGDIKKQQSAFEMRKKAEDNEPVVLPGSITKLVQSVYDTQGDPLSLEVGRCFGTDTDELIRKRSKSGARIVIRRRLSGDSLPFEHGLTFGTTQNQFRSSVPEELKIQPRYPEFYRGLNRLRHRASRQGDDAETKFFVGRLLETLAALALPHLVGALHSPAFYLPADRTGVMHAHSVVVSALIESASMTGLRTRTPMLSGVLADFLEQLIELDSRPHRRSKSRDDPGARIEDAILHGSVGMERAETSGYPSFTYRPEGWKDSLPLMNASSMVSELAPVVLYLRHRVSPGDVLIVEEPESHLHPAMQVEFTRQLAALVRSGIRVIVTTHSEWVLEELANIVGRSGLSEKQQKEVSGSDVALSPDQVGAWLFKPNRRPRGSVVEEIRLDDSGLYRSGFDEVAAALHNDWAEISSWIGNAE